METAETATLNDFFLWKPQETATSGNLVNSLALFAKQVFPFSKQSWFGEVSENIVFFCKHLAQLFVY